MLCTDASMSDRRLDISIEKQSTLEFKFYSRLKPHFEIHSLTFDSSLKGFVTHSYPGSKTL